MINLNNKKTQYIITFSIIFIITIYIKLYQNVISIFEYKFDERINKVYGHCSNGENIGYLINLKKNYNFHNNPNIINYIHVANVKWAIFNPKKINKKSKDFIFLNYPGEKVLLKLKQINKTFYRFDELNFYLDKVDKIETLQITFLDKEKNEHINLEIYSKEPLKEKNLLYNFEIYNEVGENKIEFFLNIDLKNLYKKKIPIYFKLKNIENNKIKKLSMIGKNKFLLKNFKIINQNKNCYYAQKI